MTSPLERARAGPAEPSRAFSWWLLFLTLAIAVRPLSTPDLWWTLSRGREVIDGSFSPSQDLLALDEAREADWLGGIPFYLLWSLGGIHALAAVLLVAAFASYRVAVRSEPIRKGDPVALLVIAPALISLRQGLQPDPVLFDLVGLAVLARMLAMPDKSPRPIAVGLLFLLWSNFGPRPVWGLLLLAAHLTAGRAGASVLVAALLGGACNPRGFLAWKDAVMQAAPMAFLDPANSLDPGWRGIFLAPYWETETVAFLVAWLIWFIGRTAIVTRPALFEHFVRCAVPLLAAALARSNLPLCGMWILLDVLRFPVEAPRRELRKPIALLLGVVLTGLVLADAAGYGFTPGPRFAWGIAAENDPRLLDLPPRERRDAPYVVWTGDRRSAGFVCWMDADDLVAADHPQRALLAGRWASHSAFVDDLIGSHRARYRREDGSWGGWTAPAAAWNLDLLLVPADALEFNRALVESPWKPVDLDAPVIPYVAAEDPQFARPIVESLRQQGFVEFGPWRPTLDIFDPQGWRFDPLEAVGFGPSTDAAVRQSKFFRSLDMPLAALRVLRPIRERALPPALAEEFRACQSDLARQEWATFGEAGMFRKLVLARGRRRSVEPEPWEAIGTPPSPQVTVNLMAAVDAYLKGDLQQAIRTLTGSGPEERLARAMLWLEEGNPAECHRELVPLLEEREQNFAAVAARYWVRQLEQYVGVSDRAPGSSDP